MPFNGDPVSLNLDCYCIFKVITQAAGFPTEAFVNDGTLGSCRKGPILNSPPDEVRQILRDAKRANSPSRRRDKFSAAQRLQILRTCTLDPTTA